MCLLQVFLLFFFISTSFSSLLEANERKISLDYFIELGHVFVEVTVLPQGTGQHLKGMKFSIFLGNFRNNFPHSFVSHIIFHLSTDTLPQSNPQSLQHCFNLSQTSPF